jgi:predicted O-methyltransferase YrrM
MKELFTKVEQVVNSMQHGWCSVEKACTLASAIIALRATNVLEIGVYSGRSLVPMALALQWVHQHHNTRGLIVGIDAWDNTIAIEGMEGSHRQWWGKLPMEQMYELCKSTLLQYNLVHYVQLIQGRSNDKAIMDRCHGVFDLVHIDGSHSEQASMFDVTYYGYKVREGGLLFLDDREWSSKAYQTLPSIGYKELYQLDTGAVFQRVKSDFT